MPEFRYVALDAEGEPLDGTITADDRAAAIRQVEKRGAFPISIELAEEERSVRTAVTKLSKVEEPAEVGQVAVSATSELTLSHTQQHLFTEQLAHLLSAGMTLDEALGILVKRLKQDQLQGLSRGLHEALVGGRSLSQALGEYPRVFSPLYVNLVASGEASGALAEILDRLVVHLADIKALRERVQQALLYPAILVFAGLGLVIVFMTVMVPKITGFFKGSGQTLPAATHMLVELNGVIVHYWWAAAVGAIVAYAGFRAFTRQPEGQLAWDAFIWRLPLYGRIVHYRFYAQFARTLATLLSNGVTMLRALELLTDVSGNAWVKGRMQEVCREVVDGAALSAALSRLGLFPELFVDMLAVGEQTGKVSSTMEKIAGVYERELDREVRIVSTLLPPLVMVVIAAIVGIVVYAIMSAVFGLTQNLRIQIH